MPVLYRTILLLEVYLDLHYKPILQIQFHTVLQAQIQIVHNNLPLITLIPKQPI